RLKYIQSLFGKYIHPDITQSINFFETMFLQGKLLFRRHWDLENHVPSELGKCNNMGGTSGLGGWAFSINKKLPPDLKDAAIKFVRYFTSKEYFYNRTKNSVNFYPCIPEIAQRKELSEIPGLEYMYEFDKQRKPIGRPTYASREFYAQVILNY